MPKVFVVSGTDTLLTYADATGYFCIGGVPAGTYSVKFEPVTPYLKKAVDGVTVVNGKYSDLGTVTIVK